MPIRTENSRERLDNSLNKIRQLTERWQNKPPLEDFNISKGYIEGRLHVLVFFCITGELDEYVAFFRNGEGTDQRDTKVPLFGRWESPIETGGKHLGNFRIAGSVVYALDTLGVGKDEVVFIGNVHLVKTPQATFPSDIWLLKVNPLLIRDANALYGFCTAIVDPTGCRCEDLRPGIGSWECLYQTGFLSGLPVSARLQSTCGLFGCVQGFR